MTANLKVTYYLEILSSWCHWAEPAWDELKVRYSGRVDFDWKIALMQPADFPTSLNQCQWFYRRSGTIMRSPYMLNAGWFEADRQGHYEVPNWVAEASKDFLAPGDERVRKALNIAGVREGRKIGGMAEAILVAAESAGIDPVKLRTAAESAGVKARVDQSTAEFHAHAITQRPAFVIENAIGDKAVFSGLARLPAIAASIDALLDEAAAYASHAAHFGSPPPS